MTVLKVGPARYTRAGHIEFGRYGSGELAMSIVSGRDEPEGVATVSVVPYGAPDPGEHGVWLKGWSENIGVPEALVKAGIVTLTGRIFATGYTHAEHAILTEKAIAAMGAA